MFCWTKKIDLSIFSLKLTGVNIFIFLAVEHYKNWNISGVVAVIVGKGSRKVLKYLYTKHLVYHFTLKTSGFVLRVKNLRNDISE